MGGGGTQQTTSHTGSDNPEVKKTQTQLLQGLQSAHKGGIDVFDKSLYAGVGPTTQNSWAQTLAAAGNPDFASGIGGAMSDFGEVAAGKRFGEADPGFARLRSNLTSDVLRETNAAFGGSGLFGSDSNMEAAGEGLGNALAGLDYQNHQSDIARQQQAAQMLPGLFQAGLMPGATAGAVGAAQDADRQAGLLAENDLFRRKNDTDWDALARSSSILSGTAAAGGQTTTQTSPQTPWWQVGLGGALGLGSMFL